MVERNSPEQKLKRGEVVLFQYHEWMDRKPTDDLMKRTGAVGQFDLGIQLNGLNRGYSLMHTWIPKKQ